MSTIAWLFILASAVIVRGVAKGRVVELPGDIRDMLLGGLTGDFDAVKEAAGRTGEGLTAPVAAMAGGSSGEVVDGGAPAAGGAAKGQALIAEMKRLGAGKRYVWGGTFAGGRGGDCSGLVWRAMRNLGYYKGVRFTTSTFPRASKGFATVVSSPAPGDIAVWQRGGVKGHIGVVTGAGRFFSALNPELGIRDAPIAGISGRLTYYRLK